MPATATASTAIGAESRRMPARWRRSVRAALTNGASLERAAQRGQVAFGVVLAHVPLQVGQALGERVVPAQRGRPGEAGDPVECLPRGPFGGGADLGDVRLNRESAAVAERVEVRGAPTRAMYLYRATAGA